MLVYSDLTEVQHSLRLILTLSNAKRRKSQNKSKSHSLHRRKSKNAPVESLMLWIVPTCSSLIKRDYRRFSLTSHRGQNRLTTTPVLQLVNGRRLSMHWQVSTYRLWMPLSVVILLRSRPKDWSRVLLSRSLGSGREARRRLKMEMIISSVKLRQKRSIRKM